MEATERLCAEQSPAEVSVRDIASEAGVNHGQVHHYFGSKRQLVGRTLERIERTFNEQLVGSGDVEVAGIVDVAVERRSFSRMLAWLVLEGVDLTEFRDLRTGKLLSDALQAEGWAEEDAIVAATEIMVLAGGWALFRPALIAVNDLDAERIERVEGALRGLMIAVVRAAPDRAATGE